MSYQSHGSGKEYRDSGLRKWGDSVIIEPEVLIYYPDKVEIDEGTYIGNRSILKGYMMNTVSIRIGKRCWVGENTYMHGAGGIEIGDRVGIGPNVTMLTSYHVYKENTVDQVMDNPLCFRGITIRDGTDIGAGVCVCPGTTIGKYSVIYMGSTVFGTLPDYSIFAGNRLIGQRKPTGFNIFPK